MEIVAPTAAADAAASRGTAGWRIAHRHPWLVLDFGAARAVLGWPVVGPHDGQARRVAWLQVKNADLPLHRDPGAYFRARAAADGIEAELGLLTAADLGRFAEAQEGVAHAVATAGLGNAESVVPSLVAGASCAAHVGTINIVASLDMALAPGARLEALSIAAEARTAAVLAHGRALADGRPATGTGTDCIVLASVREGRLETHAGLHTPHGRMLGAVVYRAVAAALRP